MKRTRLHSATAGILCLLYLVIGLAGESLHYWVEAIRLGESEGESAEIVAGETSTGYFHCHGPDHHVHYHRVRHPQSTNSNPSVSTPAVAKRTLGAGIAFRAPGQPHEAHACPLLAVVSTLKLGQGGLLTWSLEVSNHTFIESRPRQAHRQAFYQLNLARGPPSAPAV